MTIVIPSEAVCEGIWERSHSCLLHESLKLMPVHGALVQQAVNQELILFVVQGQAIYGYCLWPQDQLHEQHIKSVKPRATQCMLNRELFTVQG